MLFAFKWLFQKALNMSWLLVKYKASRKKTLSLLALVSFVAADLGLDSVKHWVPLWDAAY